MSSDFSDLDRLAADIGAAPEKLRRNSGKALEVTARNIKDTAQEYANFHNPSHAPSYGHKISYDRTGDLEFEIGPTLGGQGSLGGILEDGGLRNSPQNNLRDALIANQSDLVAGLGKALEDSL